MFVIGHDCGHRSFSKNRLLEDIVGTLMFMPLIYPFEPWRIKHNHHHAHTNKCASPFSLSCAPTGKVPTCMPHGEMHVPLHVVPGNGTTCNALVHFSGQ